MLGVRCAGGPFDVGARAGAGIDELASFELFKGLPVTGQPLRLNERDVVPVEPEPAQVGARLLGGPGLDARRIDVLDAQDNRPPCERADSQAIRYVRALPTCCAPVGDGARRPIVEKFWLTLAL